MRAAMKVWIVTLLARLALGEETLVDHGSLECEDNGCQLKCDYGYIAKDRRFYPLDEENLDEKAVCVPTMGFIVGCHMPFLLNDISINKCYAPYPRWY